MYKLHHYYTVGEDALEVYNTFEFTTAADKMKVKPICENFQEYCNPRKNVAFERYKFFTHVQGSKGFELTSLSLTLCHSPVNLVPCVTL